MDLPPHGTTHPVGTGSGWILAFLDPYLADLAQGPSLLLIGMMMVAGVLGTAGCPFTIPTMLGIAGTAGTTGDASSSAKKRGLRLAVSFSGGMWLGMIVLGTMAGSAASLSNGPVRRIWSLVMVGLAVFLGIRILRGRSSGVPFLPDGLDRASAPGAFLVGLFYSAGPPLISLVFVIGLGFGHMTPAFGALLGFSFGLGRSIPFVFAGMAADSLAQAGCRMNRKHWVRYAGASLMFLVAGYYLYLLNRS